MTSRSPSREPGTRLALVALALALAAAQGCSATSTQHPMGDAGNGASSNGGNNGDGGSIVFAGNLNTPAQTFARCNDPNDLRCLKVDCPADSSPSTTSISGKVYDPAGRVPLYNAVVYVVNPADLPKLGTGAQCESCSANFPDAALAVDLTKSDGSFKVTDMPVGAEVPIVIQLGKWRRQVKVKVDPCVDNPLSVEDTRLPRNSTEGDLPRIAVTTGGSDALECLIKKIGVDVEEFTPADGGGRVNLFAGYGAAKEMVTAGKTVPLEAAETLWADSGRMLDYDMMLMSCEGDDNLWNDPSGENPPPDDANPRPVGMHLEVRKYADLGGRIFGSHWHHRWINSDDSTPGNPYPAVATFSTSAKDIGDVTVSVDASFPKGLAFQDWLVQVGASSTPGQLDVVKAEHSVDAVDDTLARRWIYGTDPGGTVGGNRVPEMVQYFSFTTPVGEPECGRMVFSDVHVSFGGGDYAESPFPERCDVSPDTELSPQEKALEFMIFDLSSCIQKEDAEVQAPISIVK